MDSAVVVILFVLNLVLDGVLSYVPVTKDMKSFSSAIKAGKIAANVEKLLYEHSSGQPGVITEQWFTGKVKFFCSYNYIMIMLINRLKCDG